jgi:cytoskeletal protein RodZ
MRTSQSRLIALMVFLLAIILPSNASATAVVDQYTEQVPSAGGPVIADGGSNSSNPVSTDADSQGDTGSVGAGLGSSPSGTDPTDASNGANQNEDSRTGVSQASETAAGSDGAGTGTGATVVSTSENDGIGWLFPTLLLGVAVTMAGVLVSRRKRNDPATR